MQRLPVIANALLCVIAAAIFFAPPPAGAPVAAMHAAAVVVLTTGLWALGSLPELVTALLFFALATVLAIASPAVVFSGFTSTTLWLVLGGLFIAEAVRMTGLGRRFAALLFDRCAASYGALLCAVAVAGTVLAFFMPATVGRVLLLIPIVLALAERVGLERDSSGFNGLCILAIMVTFQSGSGILPANAPNLVLAGSAEALYKAHFMYAEWLWVMFPVLGLIKGFILVALVWRLFPARIVPVAKHTRHEPMSAAERRLVVILVLSLILWATDFLHGVHAGWVALAAAVACLMPGVGMLPPTSFNDVRLGSFFYVGAAIGLGALANASGLGALLGAVMQHTLHIEAGADFTNFMSLSLVAMLVGMITTNPAQPAVMAPLAAQFAEATGWPLNSALMTLAVGFTVLVLPYQVPPVVIGIRLAGVSMLAVLRLVLPLALISIVVLLPLEYLWWRIIGYFG